MCERHCWYIQQHSIEHIRAQHAIHAHGVRVLFMYIKENVIQALPTRKQARVSYTHTNAFSHNGSPLSSNTGTHTHTQTVVILAAEAASYRLFSVSIWVYDEFLLFTRARLLFVFCRRNRTMFVFFASRSNAATSWFRLLPICVYMLLACSYVVYYFHSAPSVVYMGSICRHCAQCTLEWTRQIYGYLYL